MTVNDFGRTVPGASAQNWYKDEPAVLQLVESKKWLPTLDTFRTFLSDSNQNYPALTTLVSAIKAPDSEALHA
jgi:hypothetical protein